MLSSAYAILEFRVSQVLFIHARLDGPRRGCIITGTRNGAKRIPRDSHERESTRFVRTRFFFLRCPLILCSYDFFKAELLKTRFFKDDIYCHFTASFAAVRNSERASFV